MRLLKFLNKPINIKSNKLKKSLTEEKPKDASEAREIVKNRSAALLYDMVKENDIEEFISNAEKYIYNQASKGYSECDIYWYYNEKYQNCPEVISCGERIIDNYFTSKGYKVSSKQDFFNRVKIDLSWK